MTKYNACDTYGDTIEVLAETAEEAAEKYVSTGSYDRSDSTYWVNVNVWRGKRRDAAQSFKIAVDPREPRCPEGEHDWQAPHAIVGGIKENPGVWGKGGGITMQEVCMHCGCGRLTDTWAQDPEGWAAGVAQRRVSASQVCGAG